jgi:hypothetical protein
MPERGTNPVEWLRGIAISLERLAAQGVASGAVRGATQELRAGVPADVDAQGRALLLDALVLLERLVGGAARSKSPPLAAWSHEAAEGAVRGAVEEARRLVPNLQPTTQELLARVNLWLDRSESEAVARAQAIRAPGEMARASAAGAVEGAAGQLGASLPVLAAPAAELAERVGRGAVKGAAEELGRQAIAATRNPAVRLVAGGAAAVAGAAALLLLALRRR